MKICELKAMKLMRLVVPITLATSNAGLVHVLLVLSVSHLPYFSCVEHFPVGLQRNRWAGWRKEVSQL